MSPVCPTCDQSLDSSRARVARIRGSKVVSYCSATCANEVHEVSARIRANAAGSALQNSSIGFHVKPAALAEGASATEVQPNEELESAVKNEPAGRPKVATTPAAQAAQAAQAVPSAGICRGARALSRSMSASLRKRVLLSSAAIMASGLVIAVVQSVSPTSPSPAGAEVIEAGPGTGPPSVPAPVYPPLQQLTAPLASPSSAQISVPEPTANELRSLAVAELVHQLKTGTTRCQRLAGMALARIGNEEALEALASLLATEGSDLGRVDIAYGLAVGGVDSGRSYLVGELHSRRRDVRIDAARRLAQLGDDAGRAALRNMLSVRSHRISAASILALLGDEKGLGVLQEVMASKKSSNEKRMRAAVGLGLAGVVEARSILQTILSEGKYVVDAAGALATLRDPAALPALGRQLKLSALRVGAAERLKAMGADVDLAPLASAMATSNSDGRISAAEAILVLVD